MQMQVPAYVWSDRQANCDPSLKGQIGWRELVGGIVDSCFINARSVIGCIALSDGYASSGSCNSFDSLVLKVAMRRRSLQVAGRAGVWLCGFVALWLCGFVALWLGDDGMHPEDMDADWFVLVSLSPGQGSYRKCGHFFFAGGEDF
jgi:hypothetical protein